jgi:hypothetical protein|tara:strand:+ start:832 stop:1059 length:228 start_codon:yes stop_codon:yes gene_type:complete
MIIGGRKESKPTLKDVLGVVGRLAQQVEALQLSLINSDKALNEYIEYNKDIDNFMDYLKNKYKLDDKDTKKTEDK